MLDFLFQRKSITMQTIHNGVTAHNSFALVAKCTVNYLTVYFCFQILQLESTLKPNVWHNVTLSGLALGSSNTLLFVNSVLTSTTHSKFDSGSLDFNLLNGPLYIGGHKSPQSINVSYKYYHNVGTMC